MKRFLIAVLLGFSILPLSPLLQAQEKSAKVTLKTTAGDTLNGTPGAVRDGSVSIVTDYGVVRVPVDKLTEESKAKLGLSGEADTQALRKRISELEALVERLREENAQLRKASQTVPAAPVPAARPNPGAVRTPEPATAGAYKLSSTGKRHNSRCRYFNSAGRACGPTEGVACKICGG